MPRGSTSVVPARPARDQDRGGGGVGGAILAVTDRGPSTKRRPALGTPCRNALPSFDIITPQPQWMPCCPARTPESLGDPGRSVAVTATIDDVEDGASARASWKGASSTTRHRTNAIIRTTPNRTSPQKDCAVGPACGDIVPFESLSQLLGVQAVARLADLAARIAECDGRAELAFDRKIDRTGEFVLSSRFQLDGLLLVALG